MKFQNKGTLHYVNYATVIIQLDFFPIDEEVNYVGNQQRSGQYKNKKIPTEQQY